jgi:hypothetical protein
LALHQHTFIKKALLGVVLIFLWCTILQDLFEFKQVRPLFGYYVKPQDTIFTRKNWQTGKYQKLREAYLEKEFSLRPDYVRLHNTIQYTLFHSTNITWLVFGQQHQLMGSGQIKSYLGQDSVKIHTINRHAAYLSAIQDTLNKLGKKIYTAIPPNKPEIFPEYIPASYPVKTFQNNYEKYRAAFNSRGVDLVDFVEYFKTLKASGNTSLFPANGSHWNYYGAALALEYLLKHINQTGKFKVGEIEITKTSYQKEHNGDPDIYAAMNLIKENVDDTTLYPEVKIKPVNSPKPRTIFITDSYFNHWIDFGIYNLLDSVTYYFYNNRVINKDRSETDRKFTAPELLARFDMYIIVCCETNLPELGWGFIEQMYFHFYPLAPNRAYYDPLFRSQVYNKIRDIKKDTSRYKALSQHAMQTNIRIEELCYREALKELNQEIILAQRSNGI